MKPITDDQLPEDMLSCCCRKRLKTVAVGTGNWLVNHCSQCRRPAFTVVELSNMQKRWQKMTIDKPIINY